MLFKFIYKIGHQNETGAIRKDTLEIIPQKIKNSHQKYFLNI